MGRHKREQTPQEKAAEFDQQHGESVLAAAEKRRNGTYPYDLDAKLADISTGRGGIFRRRKGE